MRNNFFRYPYLLVLIFLAIIIKIFSLQSRWVDAYYTTGIYPYLSQSLRFVFGWLPFSAGDIIYLLAFAWLVYKVWRWITMIKKKQSPGSWSLFRKVSQLALLVYIVFSVLWGLNYYQSGIAKQVNIRLAPYSAEDLGSLLQVLQQRLNVYAAKTDSAERNRLNENVRLFTQAADIYGGASRRFPFLHYSRPSLKPSIFTPVGHWFGFTGYYNPFTAEAQLKTSIPVFLKPFVITHEIAHQLGYAKENEASFVAFLTCIASSDINFVYSAYFEMFRDALHAYNRLSGKNMIMQLQPALHPRVQRDIEELRIYLANNKNFIEPFMTGAYDKYLKLNNQPKGKATYNEVIAYLVAYSKKYGLQAL